MRPPLATSEKRRFMNPNLLLPPALRTLGLLALCTTLATAADPKPPLVRELKEFGDTSGKALRETYEKAIS